MQAYKVLSGGRSPFTGSRWPLPEDGRPGAWIEATGDLGLCVNGVHACTAAQLPQWLGDELWAVELAGDVVETDAAIVARRARLLAPVRAWDATAQRAFAQACADRAGELGGAAPVLAALEHFVQAPMAGPAGYWTAVLAGERAAGRRDGPAYEAAFAAERAEQGAWLVARLAAPA